MSRIKNHWQTYVTKSVILASMLFIAACSADQAETSVPPGEPANPKQHQHETPATEHSAAPKADLPLVFDHVHGLGFTGDGQYLLLAAHDGLRRFAVDGSAWSRPEGPLHDYMGFQVVRDGFFSSGHPAPGSEIVNPLGVVKSTDQGKNVQFISLLGKTDFHVFAVGYETNSMYGYNEYPNDILPKQALYSSADEGLTWSEPAARHLAGAPYYLAAHPKTAGTLAAATDNGVFLSKDRGQSFVKVSTEVATALHFSMDGEHLLWTAPGATVFSEHPLTDGTVARTTIPLPTKRSDLILYVAQHPLDLSVYALATRTNDVYLTTDAGQTWQQIANQGNIP